MGNVGIVSLVVGGTLLAGAATYFFWPSASSKKPASSARIVPMFGREGGGVVWMGAF